VLGSRLASEQPLYGLRARGIDDGTAPHASLAEMATDYVAAVRDVQPRGPYLLGGYCMGAPVAVEIARRLEEDGERVAMLVLLDPRFRQPEGLRYREWQVRRDLGLAWARTREKRLGRAVKRRIRSMSPNAPEATEIVQALEQIREESPAEPFDLPATILISDEFGRTMQPTWHLKRIVRQPWRWRLLPGRHSQLLLPPNVDIVAAEIDAALNAAVGSSAAA
jgi:thioesterase domain-containing protein